MNFFIFLLSRLVFFGNYTQELSKHTQVLKKEFFDWGMDECSFCFFWVREGRMSLFLTDPIELDENQRQKKSTASFNLDFHLVKSEENNKFNKSLWTFLKIFKMLVKLLRAFLKPFQSPEQHQLPALRRVHGLQIEKYHFLSRPFACSLLNFWSCWGNYG